MGTEIDTIITRFETDAAKAMADLLRMKAALAATREEQERFPKPAQESERAVKGLGESITKFVRGQRAEGRTAGFLLAEFAAFIPKGSQAREILQGLTAGLIGGGGFGLALEGVSIGVKLLSDYLQEDTKRQEEAKKAAEAHAKAMRDLQFDTEKYLRSLQHAPASMEFMYQAQHDFAEKTLADRKRLGEISADLARSETNPEVLETASDLRAGTKIRNDLLKEQRELTEKVKTAQDELNAAMQSGGVRANAESSAERAAKDAEIAAATRDAVNAAEDKVFTERYEKRSAIRKAMRDASNAAEDRDFEQHYQMQLDAEQAYVDADNAIFERQYQYQLDAEQAYIEADNAEFERHYQYQLDAEQAYVEIENRLFEAAYEQRERAQKEFLRTATSGWQTFSQSVATELGKVMRHSSAYEKAMRAQGKAVQNTADLSAAAFASMAQDALASIAEQAVVKALWELAEGTAMLALSYAGAPMEGSAAAHFEAAAMYGAMAGIAGGASYAIGSSRGMTRQEREDVSAAEQERLNAMETSKGTQSTETGTTRADQVDGKTVRETRIVVYAGDPFETAAERAAKAARVLDLMDELDLRREA